MGPFEGSIGGEGGEVAFFSKAAQHDFIFSGDQFHEGGHGHVAHGGELSILVVELKASLVFGDGLIPTLWWQGIGCQGLVVVEDFIEVFGTNGRTTGVDAGVYVWVAFFVEVGFAIVFENTHFGGHHFDDRFPGGFVEFVGRNKGVASAAGGFDHGFVLQGDFLCFGVYVVVSVFVSTAAGIKLNDEQTQSQ